MHYAKRWLLPLVALGAPSLPVAVTAADPDLAALRSALEAAAARADALEQELDALEAEKHRLTELAGRMALVTDDYGYPNVLFSSVNLQVVNGQGSTETINGVGNVIVGYNEPRTGEAHCSQISDPWNPIDNQNDCENMGYAWGASHKSGSHNLVGGSQASYGGYGGLVVGKQNVINHHYAVVSGGRDNHASSYTAVVSAGESNKAYGFQTVVSGGLRNVVRADYSSIMGGESNSISTPGNWGASILGGSGQADPGINGTIPPIAAP